MKVTITLDEDIKMEADIFWLLDLGTEKAAHAYRIGKLGDEGPLMLEDKVRGKWKLEA